MSGRNCGSSWPSAFRPARGARRRSTGILIDLGGRWEAGTDRRYDRVVPVPGLAGDPRTMQEGTLWYRRMVDLPEGAWTHATLFLHGARFHPAVHLDGEKVSERPGGMTVTSHPLHGGGLRPGGRLLLEIALKSLQDMDPTDASRIPPADHWRSNVSSCLWDAVRLRLHGPARIARLVPIPDLENDRLTLAWEIEDLSGGADGPLSLDCRLLDTRGSVLARGEDWCRGTRGRTLLELGGRCRPWRPEDPACYRLRVTLRNRGRVVDEDELTFGLKDFRPDGLGFRLNDRPVRLRAGTVVWHRWCRDPEARELAFDTRWFERHIVARLKSHGANALRFHLGMPPEAFLDLCDRHGLIVQAEWSFFHGLDASRESLVEQWRSWLDLCLRHPSVCLIHPWNETEGEGLKTALAALDDLLPDYPPLVVSHRDVLHLHRYWWSLFENVGLYYDSAAQFDKPVVADEFGGNYLDGRGDPGGYPTLRESFLRFLGPGHTRELRLQLQTEANARIAEYWRRLGVAGFSPFCALGSPEDGNHHFLGQLRAGRPKPVWEALTAAYSPLSCSLDLWDRNYSPGQVLTLPLHFMNDTDEDAVLEALVRVTPEGEGVRLSCPVPAHAAMVKEVTLRLPGRPGEWRFEATLLNPPGTVRHPVVSAWRFHTVTPVVPPALTGMTIGVSEGEAELRAFLAAHGLPTCAPEDPAARLIVDSLGNRGMADGFQDLLAEASGRGCPVLLLDLGPRWLGPGDANGPAQQLQAGPTLRDPRATVMDLFGGIKVRFTELPEPESCLHPTEEGAPLWANLHRQHTWLWNGYRGGLVAPAAGMEPRGLSQRALSSLWRSRGADPDLLQGDAYYAYELNGIYTFSREKGDREAIRELRRRVRFLVEDAPALAASIDPAAEISVTDLAGLYRASAGGRAGSLHPLAVCGKNLVRTPVVRIDFDDWPGRLILSQLLTRGRLAEGFGGPGPYGVRYDPAAAQFILNMMAACVS